MRNLHGNKIVVGLLIFLLGFFKSYGQTNELYLENHDDKKFYFSIVLAGSNNSFRLSQHPRFLQDDSVFVSEPGNNGGFALGIAANMRLSRRFELRTIPFQLTFADRNILYTLKYPNQAALEDTITPKNIQSIVYSLPVHIKFKSDRIRNFRVYMFGGGKFEYDFASNANRTNAESLVKLNKTDWGVEAGLGFNFYFPAFILSPEFKFSNGVTNRHSRDPNLKFSSVIDRITTRQFVVSLFLEGVIN
jgi:hypothetical protein